MDVLTRSVAELQEALKVILSVEKANNSLIVQSAGYLCTATGEMLGASRYMHATANVQNGLASRNPDDALRFDELLKLVQPCSVMGISKVRVGRRCDGGYVLLNDFDAIETVYSLGIADDVSFDLDMLHQGRNIQRVMQYDFSVAKPPVENPRFHFEQKRITNVKDLGELAPNSLLKIDIEGSEWDFFNSCTEADLMNFRQISVEFHDLVNFRGQRWYEKIHAVLKKLALTHQLIHIHGNNIAMPVWTGERFFPSVLEATYVRRSDYQFEACSESLPGELDNPCSLYFPEIKIDFAQS